MRNEVEVQGEDGWRAGDGSPKGLAVPHGAVTSPLQTKYSPQRERPKVVLGSAPSDDNSQEHILELAFKTSAFCSCDTPIPFLVFL